jgi:hypothetical protein
MNCNGCNCITNFNDNTEFCGRTVRSSNGNSTTVMGCDKTCSQCSRCKFVKVETNAKRVTPQRTRTPVMEKKPLTKQAFLKMLKRQQELNALQGIGKGPMANSTENNNADANFDEDLNLSNHSHKEKKNRGKAKNHRESENNLKEAQNCTQYSTEECTSNKGCEWDNENVVCKSLEVTFYTQDGEKGISFKLPVGNYDKTEIGAFEFKPEFMAVPLGLRVKVWKKSGYVGPNLGFLGNNNPDMAKVKKNLFPLEVIGSIQICNMETCVKPSQYEDMQLISLIDGNNIDFVEDNVKDLGSYKESLREKIHRKLLDVRFTHKECLEQVSHFLKLKDIDITEDLSNVNNSFTLQKIHYELDNLPICDKLIEMAANKKFEVHSVLSPIETILENIPAPSFISDNNISANNISANNISANNISANNVNSNKRNANNNNINTLLEEEGNINFIIFIFVFLLIILLVAALVYIYYSPKTFKGRN